MPIEKTQQAANPGMLDEFKARATEFAKQFSFLQGKSAVVARHPKLKADYTALMDRGAWVRSAIEKVTGATDTVVGWFKNLLGGVEVETRSLGFLPLVPVAIIAASTAAIAKWMSDAYVFGRKLRAVEDLEAKGLSPQEAAELVKGQEGAGLFNFSLGGAAMPVYVLGIGALAYLMWRFRKRG